MRPRSMKPLGLFNLLALTLAIGLIGWGVYLELTLQDAKPAGPSGPAVILAATEYDLGTVPLGRPVEVIVKLTNTGPRQARLLAPPPI